MIRFPEDRSSRSSHEKSLLKERKRENSREILWFIGEKIDEKKITSATVIIGNRFVRRSVDLYAQYDFFRPINDYSKIYAALLFLWFPIVWERKNTR